MEQGHAGAAPPEGESAREAQGAGSRFGAAARASAPQGKKRRKRKKHRKVFAKDAARSASGVGSGAADPGHPENAAIADAMPAAHPLRQDQRQVRPGGFGHEGLGLREDHHRAPAFAALDLGTNNCRLLVAVPGRPGQFRVVDAFSRIVRLGEGLTANGRLGQAAMDRAVEALKVCGDKLRNRSVRRSRLIATEACRSADNGAEFLQRVEREAGLKLEIIDRRTEARLAVSGCGSLVERDTDGVVLFDIGGGSSEIALIDLSRQRTPRLASHIVSWTSLPLGVVSLAERFGGKMVSRDVFQAMVADVRVHLEAFSGRDRLAHVSRTPRFHLLGTSGTVTTLAGIHLELDRYDRRKVDGLWMTSEQVDAMMERLLSWDFQARVANPCIGADRADLVLAGCAILQAIREVWPSERLRVADRGLREGILTELMAEDGVWRRGGRFGARP